MIAKNFPDGGGKKGRGRGGCPEGGCGGGGVGGGNEIDYGVGDKLLLLYHYLLVQVYLSIY